MTIVAIMLKRAWGPEKELTRVSWGEMVMISDPACQGAELPEQGLGVEQGLSKEIALGLVPMLGWVLGAVLPLRLCWGWTRRWCFQFSLAESAVARRAEAFPGGPNESPGGEAWGERERERQWTEGHSLAGGGSNKALDACCRGVPAPSLSHKSLEGIIFISHFVIFFISISSITWSHHGQVRSCCQVSKPDYSGTSALAHVPRRLEYA